jgi:hypothetical protein
MGGLVIRAALRKPTILPKIKVLLHICMPASGAVVLYRRMFTGLVPRFDGTGSIADRAFRFLLGDSRQGFVGNFSGLPGAVELMPGTFLPAAWNPSLPAIPYNQLFSNTLSPPGIVPEDIGLSTQVISDLNDRVADLYDFQTFFGNPADQLHPGTYLIYGSGSTPPSIPLTDVQIAFQNGAPIPIQDITGDGTVPAASALSLQLPPARMTSANVEHSLACANPAVVTQTAAILTPYLP